RAAVRARLVAPAGAGGETVARDQMLWQVGRGEIALEEYMARFGDHAPAWDVAVATDREAPDRVRALAGALAAQPLSPRQRQAEASATNIASASSSLREILAIAE